MKNNPSWFTYLLRCADNSLYAGVTTDLDRRLQEHNKSNIKGAKYTRVRRPVTLVYSEPAGSRQQACKREYQIRKLSKKEKEKLVYAYSTGNNKQA